MQKHYVDEQTFEKINFSETPLTVGEYDNCQFISCDFSSAVLSHLIFTDCTFVHCNMSSVKLVQTAFRNVQFSECKLLGVHFEHCNPFLLAMRFEKCLLNLATFYKLVLKKTHFKACSLHEVDFTEADFTGSLFEECDFAQAVFDQTILEKADLRSSYNYALDPEKNKIRKAKFSHAGIAGLLAKYDITIE